ncbi:MAG: hypothetical protein GW775_02800 [Candidatus Magasanikbacteria bacterium]|nr:hypothetical protein [Candidatus Magasanikbacteria bacterium]
MAFSSTLSNRIDSAGYFLGKFVRFGFFIVFIFSLFRVTSSIAGYSKYEVLLFFFVFNLVDVVAQGLFRGIYVFRNQVRTGTFDFVLTRPLRSLFYVLFQLSDLLDLLFLIPIVVGLIYVIFHLPVFPSSIQLFLFGLFFFVSLLILTSFHIIAATIMVRYVDADQAVWLYRDFMTLGRFPPEILSGGLQFFFTILIPIIVVVAFPTKILLGILSPLWMLVGIVIAALFFLISLLLWNSGLKQYSSASS